MVVSYKATVSRPMGVIFGENPEPYLGLVVDDVSEGMNGGRAGLRRGDQLLAVDGRVVLGRDFDSVMGLLTDESSPVLVLSLYRGPVRDLYTILGNQMGEGEAISGYDGDYGDDYDDEGSAPVIMDENYESPVRIEVKEAKPLTPADFVKAIGKLGSMVAETITAPPPSAVGEASSSSEKPKRRNTGFLGFGAESIQLEGDDALGYKPEKPKPDDF
jgi:PDZ domain